MPRRARKEINSKFLHIMIQGINREYIFNNEKDIERYLKITKEKLKNIDLDIISYCIMNNHAHFLVFAKDINQISVLMKKINTSYAIYYNNIYNRCGYVFRDRFKSEEILSRKHLINCIHYIHNNPVKAEICKKQEDYKYSSYREFKNKSYLINKNKVLKILGDYDIDIKSILIEDYTNYNFIDDVDVNNKNKLKDDVLEEFLKKKNICNMNELRYNDTFLKEIAIIMNKQYHFTQKEIAESIGVNRLKIHRLIHE